MPLSCSIRSHQKQIRNILIYTPRALMLIYFKFISAIARVFSSFPRAIFLPLILVENHIFTQVNIKTTFLNITFHFKCVCLHLSWNVPSTKWTQKKTPSWHLNKLTHTHASSERIIVTIFLSELCSKLLNDDVSVRNLSLSLTLSRSHDGKRCSHRAGPENMTGCCLIPPE